MNHRAARKLKDNGFILQGASALKSKITRMPLRCIVLIGRAQLRFSQITGNEMTAQIKKDVEFVSIGMLQPSDAVRSFRLDKGQGFQQSSVLRSFRCRGGSAHQRLRDDSGIAFCGELALDVVESGGLADMQCLYRVTD